MTALLRQFLDRMGRNSMSALDSFVKIRYAFSARKYNVFLWADLSRFDESAPGILACLWERVWNRLFHAPGSHICLGVDLNWLI